MISSLRYLPTSRGTLVSLRQRLQLVKRGKEVLEMRRDQLVKEIFLLIDKLKLRSILEDSFVNNLKRISRLRLTIGELDFHSKANLVRPPKLDALLVSIQGVPVTQVRVLEDVDLSKLKDPELEEAIEKLWDSLKGLIEIANIEVAVERLCQQLAYINRIVNSLDRNIIPQLEEAIRHIEEKLEQESLEEFIRLKKLSDSRGRG